MKFLTTLLLFFCSTSLLASSTVVLVQTENQLYPVYIETETNDSRFDTLYLNDLKKVVMFDFDNNGITHVERNRDNVAHLIKVIFKHNKLQGEVHSFYDNQTRLFEEVVLSGYLSEDRKNIHRFTNAVQKALFGKEGVANTHILYTKRIQDSNGKWLSEVWECDYDGANERQVTHDGAYCVTPTYFPPKPGSKSGNFFYVSYKKGQPKIYIASLKDGVGQRLTLLHGNQLLPALSRQRDQVAFISDATGNPDLFILPFDPEKGAIEKPRQIYTSYQATQGSPTFSPDGNRIAFVSDKDGSARIYMMVIPEPNARLKDLKPTLLTKFQRGSTAPCWSPDGTKIAYCTKVDGVRQIWMYDLVKGKEKQLTYGAYNKENPSWAPNSLHIVYNTTDDDNSELYLIHHKGSKPVKISSGQGGKRFPSWEP